MEKEKDGYSGIEKLLNPKKSEILLIESLEIYKLKKNNFVKCLVFMALSAILSYGIGMSPNTVSIFQEIVDLVLNVTLALLGITFTGYTFFQALINGRLIEVLVTVQNEETGDDNFNQINGSFVKLMMLYIFVITISFFLKIFSVGIDSDFILTGNMFVNETIAIVGIGIYIYFSVMAIWHIKSFVYNIFQLFNMRAVREFIDTKNSENKTEE